MRPWRIVSLWGPVGLGMAALYVASAQSEIASIEVGWDKALHATAYAVLALLALRACHGGLSRLSPGPAFAAALLTLGYGALDEIHQGFVPGRDPSVLDWLADLAGVAVAVAVVGWWVTRRSSGGTTGAGGGAEG